MTTRSTTAAFDDTLINLPQGQVGGYFDLGLDTLRSSAQSSASVSPLASDVTMRELFMLTGPASGKPITFRIHMPMLGHFSVYPGVPQGYEELTATIAVNGVTVDSLEQGGGCCHSDFPEDLSVMVTQNAGDVFEIAERLRTFVSSNSAFLAVGAGLHIENLPVGVTVLTCHGDSAAVASADEPRALAALRIDDVWPNPARGRIAVAFAVPSGGPVSLQLIDVAGRVIEARVLDAPSATQRTSTLGEQTQLAPGTYFVRLSQGAKIATRRVAIVR